MHERLVGYVYPVHMRTATTSGYMLSADAINLSGSLSVVNK